MKTSLKSVLRNFLNHYETLESRHKLCHGDDLYVREFQALKDLTESLKTDPTCGCSEGESDVNRRKNRYKDILPYDHSRVVLSEYPGVPGSDYINANYVRGSSSSSCAYIASQGPLPNTVVDFWRMIWECDVTVIVMACNEREAGKYKCESYWPEEGDDEEHQYGNITVYFVKWRQVCPDFLVRTLKVKADSTERTVCQFHYQTWPDHGVPTAVQPILELVRLMRDVQMTETRPILIHCSAGCGRTGTICSIDYVWALLRTGKLSDDFSLHEIISDMRRQRIAMVQTLEQYMLCYRAVATLFEQQLKMIDSHTYENIDEDGEPLVLRELLEDVDSSQCSGNTRIEKREENEKKSEANDNCNHNGQKRIESHPTQIKEKSSAQLLHSSFHCDEIRHERLVGKATVIRRPSIAKLKAIFENQAMNTSESSTLMRSRSIGSTLQRSHSTKENPRFSQSNVEINDFTNSSENLIINSQMMQQNQNVPQYYNDNYYDSNSQHSEQRITPDEIQRHIIHSLSQNELYNTQHLLHHRPHSQPPPKPPRTYQHIVTESNEEISHANDGRVIVSIALPKRQSHHETFNNNNANCIYEPIVRRIGNYSAPALINNEQLSVCINNQTKDTNDRSSNANIYEPIVPKYVQTQPPQPNVIQPNHVSVSNITKYFEIMRTNNGNRTLPFYDVTFNRRNFVPSSVPQNYRQSSYVSANNIQSVGSRPVYENIYPLHTKNNPNPLQCTVRPTVSYVKPKPIDNSNNSKSPINMNTPYNTSPASSPVKSAKPSIYKNEPKSAISSNNSNQNNLSSFSLFTNPFKGLRKKKSSNKNKSVLSITNISLPINGTVTNNNSPTRPTIRPPHSHRFSPPTQWTQV